MDFPIEFEIFAVKDGGQRSRVVRFIIEEPQGPANESRLRITVGRDAKSNLVAVDDPARKVSSQHFELEFTDTEMLIADVGSSGKGSTNGTFVDGERVPPGVPTRWDGYKSLRFGDFDMRLAGVLVTEIGGVIHGSDNAEEARDNLRTESLSQDKSPFQSIIVDPASQSSFQLPDPDEPGFPDGLFHGPVVSVSDLRRSGQVAVECTYLALGGGLGSFCWVDHLRVFGVPASEIRVIGTNRVCFENYERYCRNSQIPRHERLRSNAISTPDNIWGFPGYASREAFRALKGQPGYSLSSVMTVFGEPTLAISYTPQAGHVFESLTREMARIGWDDMFVQARILSMRQIDDGRYAVSYRTPLGQNSERREHVVIAKYVHMATGYPSVQFVHDLQRYKRQHHGTADRVINAYDPHEFVYDEIARSGRPETILVRGRGIVASRIYQRLVHERDTNNPNIRIIHLMRTEKPYGTGSPFRRSRRPVFNDVEIQPFNWPKACWGGALRRDIERMSRAELNQTYDALGGTTTAEREDWTEIIERGKNQGFYQTYYGSIAGIEPADENKIEVTVEVSSETSETRRIVADYMIDCTGLIGDIAQSPFLNDLLTTYALPRNNLSSDPDAARFGGFEVTPDYEIAGLRNGTGRVYASGAITQGGPYVAVDSFLGLQYTALRSVDHLSNLDAAGISRFGPLRSLSEWFRWCRNRPPG
jgi:pSer/pThr/pTyr-binding forkhead associated (FHA) protein